MTKSRQIFLTGASGYTGQLVAQALSARKLRFSVIGRSISILRSIFERHDFVESMLEYDPDDPRGLLSHIDDGALILNCAGPFILHSAKLIEDASRRQILYLDVCGEQQFVADSLDRLDRIARENHATLVHSCAFESFLADIMAHHIVGESEALHDLSSYYWFDRMLTSPGTRLTMQLAEHLRTVTFQEGERIPMKGGQIVEVLDIELAGKRDRAVFVPYPEVLFFSKNFKTSNASTFILMTEAESRFSGWKPSRPPPSIEDIVERHRRRRRPGPTPVQRANQGCGVAVIAKRHTDQSSIMKLDLRDPYGLTAEIMAWCCSEALKTPFIQHGVLSPAELFSGGRFLRDLEAWPRFFNGFKRWDDHVTPTRGY